MGIVFIHGRAQEAFKPDDLLKLWVKTLRRGSDAAGVEFSRGIEESCHLAYYATDLVSPKSPFENCING